MCSVIGYIGKGNCRKIIVEGLSRLEYRGYDSAGFACLASDSSHLRYAKAEGRLQNLINQLEANPIDGKSGIGHTRWSTHGIVSQQNTHPHIDCKNKIAIVHNGIIENHQKLKENLKKSGHNFVSETDTEVIVHLLESDLSSDDIVSSLSKIVNRLEGAYAFLCLSENLSDTILAVRKRSPLCIGIGENEMFLASDALAFAGKTNKVIFLPDESFAVVKKDSIELYDFSGKQLPVNAQNINLDWKLTEKGGYESFMLKEIYEQKKAITDTVNYCKSLGGDIWEQLGISVDEVVNLQNINMLGCGTSWHAARIGQFFFETIAKIPAKVLLASEFRYMPLFNEKNSLYVAISQSGETADTLEALNLVKLSNTPTIAITNVGSSTIARESNGFLLTQAGPEIAVASTKAFTTQLTALYWLANAIALEKNIISKEEFDLVQNDLLVAAHVIENLIENYKDSVTQKLAKFYSSFKKFIFLGRHISYPLAMESALKLKEISYIFSQSYPAGELKHGPIALIDEETPVVIFSSLDEIIYQKLLGNVQEVKSRKGHIISFAYEGQDELISLSDTTFIVPKVNPLLGPLAMTGLMQFFVYQIAKELGRPIDKPRNLAKSVTVE